MQTNLRAAVTHHTHRHGAVDAGIGHVVDAAQQPAADAPAAGRHLPHLLVQEARLGVCEGLHNRGMDTVGMLLSAR